jgi:hypothetical protein
MSRSILSEIGGGNGKPPKRCLSCGTTLDTRRRKYCSQACRQRLRFKLDLRTGLLRALNTRYAVFHFTENTVILDLILYDVDDILSFIYPRSRGGVPADDFSKMADDLGKAWWDEVNRTRKRYLATRHVLSRFKRNRTSRKEVLPLDLWIPGAKKRALMLLMIREDDLAKTDCRQEIKAAFRRQAMKHHPDHGGEHVAFLKIQAAYEELLEWARQPTFFKRRGFPDKWFYEGDRNRWLQPVPMNRR